MKLLFKRGQTPGQVARVTFRLWSKVELDDEETEIVKRYGFDNAMLIEAIQPTLVRNAILVGIAIWTLCMVSLFYRLGMTTAFIIGLAAGSVAAFFYFHQKRETIYVKDLIHGRFFSCPSIIELARKEAWLGVVTSFLRQVMESAKHWDGTETLDVEALPKAEAKLVMIRGLKGL